MLAAITIKASCVQGASSPCRDYGPPPWFVVGGIVVLVGLVLFLNWTRSER